MLRNHIACLATHINQSTFAKFTLKKRLLTTLTPTKITELLRKNEIHLGASLLPNFIKSIECNQLASNSPIEDRLRVSIFNLPGVESPTLILGVFDGHGGGTTADIISRRLFNYIALSLCPNSIYQFKNRKELEDVLIDLHNSPPPLQSHNDGSGHKLQDYELKLLFSFKEKLEASDRNSKDISANLKASFNCCDQDLSKEIQENLIKSSCQYNQSSIHHYLSAAVSGCCALVLVIHQGVGYIASSGDCRSVLGVVTNEKFKALELNEEHNCDNINEVRRLSASHPIMEQNTLVKHNRLLGHLMPFRAFGDYNYKWPAETITACGITRAFGSGVIPSNYKTPPYLIAEPDIHEVEIVDKEESNSGQDRYIILASDGLWELFESSRDVIETLVDHRTNASQLKDEYDENSATHILRSALCSGSSHQDCGLEKEELKRLHHIRLESTLTLPQSVVRNFRDDISLVVLRL